MTALPEGLLEATKNYLDITWPDLEGDKKLAGILARGIGYLDDVAGEPLNYSAEDRPRALLLDYAMYVRSGALAEFQVNYLPELLALRTWMEVERYGQARAAEL